MRNTHTFSSKLAHYMTDNKVAYFMKFEYRQETWVPKIQKKYRTLLTNVFLVPVWRMEKHTRNWYD